MCYVIVLVVLFQSPIQASLLKLSSSELNKLSLECFVGEVFYHLYEFYYIVCSLFVDVFVVDANISKNIFMYDGFIR